MKSNKHLLFAINILIVCITGCKNESTSVDNNIEGILPLVVGNVWIYRTNYTVGIPSLDTTIFMDTMTVVRDSMIGKERWFAISYSSNREKLISGEDYFINRIDGLYILHLRQQAGSYQYPSIDRVFKYPSNVGDSIINHNFVTKMVSNSDTVGVNAQQVTCITYLNYLATDTTLGYDLSYLSPKVGIIKTDTYSKSGRLGITRKLMAYSLF